MCEPPPDDLVQLVSAAAGWDYYLATKVVHMVARGPHQPEPNSNSTQAASKQGEMWASFFSLIFKFFDLNI